MRILFARRVIAFAATLVLVVAGAFACEQRTGTAFPRAAVDYFHGMDGGIRLDAAEVRGRNTWLMWTSGNEAFWDYLAGRSFGTFDLLKVLDSRKRPHRFATYGVINEPGLRPA